MRYLLLFSILVLSSCGTAPDPVPMGPFRFEEEIRAFERADARWTPGPGRVLFVGSSSVRLWDSLHADMAPMPVLNRGFGGSETREVLRVVDRIVLPYEPSVIVYYCGDNDLGTDSTDAESAAAGFTEFAELIADRSPGTKVLYMSIKPSPARWSNWAAMERANAIVARYCGTHGHAEYVDLATPLLGAGGEPNPELFAGDGLHLNEKGYRRWAGVLRGRVFAAWQEHRSRD